MAKELRLYFIPGVTEVAVALDGKNFEKIILDKMHHEEDDYDRTVSVTPGVSRIRFTAVPNGIEHYFWTYSDDTGNEETLIGDGYEMSVCEMVVPENLPDEMTIYVEEGHREEDFGYDSRDLYFKSKACAVRVEQRVFSISRIEMR